MEYYKYTPQSKRIIFRFIMDPVKTVMCDFLIIQYKCNQYVLYISAQIATANKLTSEFKEYLIKTGKMVFK